MDIRVADKIRNELLRRSGLGMQPPQHISSSGGGEDTWAEWIKKDGLLPQQFGTQELAEETEGGQDTGGC